MDCCRNLSLAIVISMVIVTLVYLTANIASFVSVSQSVCLSV